MVEALAEHLQRFPAGPDGMAPRVTGRLEPGLAADLLFVQGNRERDITALQRRDTVFIRGNPLPRVRDSLEHCSADESSGLDVPEGKFAKGGAHVEAACLLIERQHGAAQVGHAHDELHGRSERLLW